MPRKRPKSLDASVTTHAKRLEAWVYIHCDRWKRKYMYTLINEYRMAITNAKNNIIAALELHNRYREDKIRLYNQALGCLSIAESNMDIMILPEVGVMNEKDWAQAAQQIDEIRIEVSKLVNSLSKGYGGSESPNFGTESESTNHKDA